jgi:hypothetical protein
MENQQHSTSMTEAELLSISGATHNETPYVVLSMRLNLDNYHVHNLGLTPQQAVRLWRDLCNLATTSPIMREAISKTPNTYDHYKRIVLDEPVPKRKRRKKPE